MPYGVALEAWVVAHSAVRELIFEGSEVATISVYDSNDVLLTVAILDDMTSAVNETTGELTLDILTQDESADASGTASYALVTSAAMIPLIYLPCEQGTEAQEGKCVLNTLEIVEALPTYVVSLTIPAGSLLE